MSICSREELLSLLADWKAAYKAASTGKSYMIQGRTLTRYDLSEIRGQLSCLENELAAQRERRDCRANYKRQPFPRRTRGRAPSVGGAMMPTLLNQYGQPLNTGRCVSGPSRDAGAYRGAIADNAVGTGLASKSSIPHKLLAISREEAAAIGEKMAAA